MIPIQAQAHQHHSMEWERGSQSSPPLNETLLTANDCWEWAGHFFVMGVASIG